MTHCWSGEIQLRLANLVLVDVISLQWNNVMLVRSEYAGSRCSCWIQEPNWQPLPWGGCHTAPLKVDSVIHSFNSLLIHAGIKNK